MKWWTWLDLVPNHTHIYFYFLLYYFYIFFYFEWNTLGCSIDISYSSCNPAVLKKLLKPLEFATSGLNLYRKKGLSVWATPKTKQIFSETSKADHNIFCQNSESFSVLCDVFFLLKKGHNWQLIKQLLQQIIVFNWADYRFDESSGINFNHFFKMKHLRWSQLFS